MKRNVIHKPVNTLWVRRLTRHSLIGMLVSAALFGVTTIGSAAPVIPPVQTISQSGAQPDVRTVRIARGDIRAAVTATGNVVPNQQSALSVEIPGTIVELPVIEGQHVDKGQLLARVDDSIQQAAFQQADFAVKAAQSALDRLLQPVDARDVANAEANVKTAEGVYSAIVGAVSPAMINAAKLKADQANEAVKTAEMLRAGAGGQFKDDDPNYQKSVAQVAIAQGNAEMAALKLEQVKNGHSLLQAIANIAYSQARLAVVKAGPRQIDIDDAQAQLATAKVLRDQAQHVLDKTRLYAPYAGTVTKVNVRLSETASSLPAILLTDDSTLFIDAQVNETDIAQITVGQPAQVALDALSGTTLNGKVQRINQFANATPGIVTYTVRVALDTPSAGVKVGMTANVTVTTQQAQNVLRIPNEYLSQDNDAEQTSVIRANPDGTYTRVIVQLGAQGSGYTEILSGLNEGDTVAMASDLVGNAAPGANATAPADQGK